MRKRRVGTSGRTYTISATGEEWAAIGAGWVRAGKRISAWAVECALMVDPLPRPSRRLILDEKQQRSISRTMEAHARSLCADAGAPSRLADDLRELLAARLDLQGRGEDAVALLRETLGEERADIVIAAMMPEPGKAVEPTEKPAEAVIKKPAAKRPRRKLGREPPTRTICSPAGSD